MSPNCLVSLALSVPLIAKSDKHDDVVAFLKKGAELVVSGEPETIQWYGVKFTDSDTFAVIDAFRNDAGREAHLAGQVAGALNANAATLLASDPQIAKAAIIANKVDPLKPATIGVRVLLTPKPGQTNALRDFLAGDAERALVEEEDFMPLWYAVEFPADKFAIIEFFEDEAARGKHLAGKVRAALFANADKLLGAAPEIARFEVIASSVKF
ncbi:ABM domain-containing protein [Mycena indigotica]|uniref:ABM domain-containing protein n=1 Tax=Mycena indigotica TaxID=2126181 RepID=A0A8H6SJL6_9AGAR|nr:ABM domain-containing protein [Mycena indigotica]KAF7299502.1 ABM domain-containing protein [Mycena indigotica]